MDTASPPPMPSARSEPPPLPQRKAFLGRVFGAIYTFFEYLFGLVTILLTLAALSAVPIIHFFSLGYLLEASARVAKSGKIRDGFIGLKLAARIGKLIVAAWLIFLPIRLIYSYWLDANVIDPNSGTAKNIGLFLAVFIVLAVLGLLWALRRGGKFRHFVWPAPFRFLRWLGEEKTLSLSHLTTFFSENLKKSGVFLADLFKLGFFGFLGGLLWLILPVSVLFVASSIPNQGLSFLTSSLGGILLAVVVLHLPFIQTRYAVNRKFSEFKDWRGARECFRKAPLALWIALVVTLLFALPLYILKIELAPREVAWIPNLVFVVFMFPARLILGWAMSRSFRREQNSHWVFRWFGRFAVLPAVFIYVFIVWLTQFLSWHGTYSLLEQHAFLLPAPMLGL